MQPKFEQQMKKGVLDMLVLKLLAQEKKYGYQLISELREKSGEVISLKEGTLYPILYRLEDEGLIESRWNEPKGREVSRKYYDITDKGKQVLCEMFTLWSSFSETIKGIMEEESV
ncbi:MAG: PadR family transcriptional regulator [Lachnospiraceae bacterium]|nr:PadR family transcriptional regulator [Lachnospiraceae bacterium]